MTLVAGLAIVAGTIAASPATAAPFVGSVRDFNSEATGVAPTGCTTLGDVTVQSAAIAGAPGGNRAARLIDASASNYPRLVCASTASAQKSVTMQLTAPQMDIGVVIALGKTSADTTGLWRFFLERSGTDVVVSVFNGTNWVVIGTAPGVNPTTEWFEVRLDASSTWATIGVDRARFSTSARASTGTTMESVIINSAGTTPLGLQLYVDDFGVANSIPAFSSTLAATAPVGQQIRFPGAAKLLDGTIVAAYYEGPSHGATNGLIKLVRSSDDGLTWSSPILVTDQTHDPRGPQLTTLNDGTLLLTYFYMEWTATPYVAHGTFVMRSTDGGLTWSSPSAVGTQMSCACGPVWPDSYAGGWSAHKGPIVELASGDLLIPLYGTTPTDSRIRATVVRSTDGGVTWDAANEVTLGVGSISYLEPNLSVLPSGELVATIRTSATPRKLYLSRSFDNGFTWTTPSATDIPAEAHSQIVLDDGSVLLTYGNPNLPGRPTEGIIIDDPSGSWNGLAVRSTLVYDAATTDQANPANIEVSPGEYLTLGYNVSNRTMSAIFTTRADYAN
ncbi:sialidase family protein [Microbacterium sp. TPD7012]|uniref:sialidase family protein n=1 Tax=Microbacterium sp. TPD7012 TaxID=2171975 RepID=UPI0014025D85|nr:sialidase family protein [Microbacterium sp. TPD7012]